MKIVETDAIRIAAENSTLISGKKRPSATPCRSFCFSRLGPLAMALGRDASVNFRIETLQIAHEVHIDRNRVLPVLEQKHELSMTLRAEAIRASYLRSCRL